MFKKQPLRSAVTLTVLLAFGALAPTSAFASVYVSGSLESSTSNVPMQTYESNAVGASLAVDLGRYIRVGITHKQTFQISNGYKNVSETDTPQYVEVSSDTHITANSLDLTLILYEGQVFLPYLTVGGVVKQYHFKNTQEGQAPEETTGALGPVPNVGAGIGLRLNRDFTLKFSYTASPGLAQDPGETEARGVWDKSSSVSLTYQL